MIHPDALTDISTTYLSLTMCSNYFTMFIINRGDLVFLSSGFLFFCSLYLLFWWNQNRVRNDLIHDLGLDEKQGIKIQFDSSYHPSNPNFINRVKSYLSVGALLFIGNQFLLVCPKRYSFFSNQLQPVLPILITSKPVELEFIRRRNCIRVPIASYIIKPRSIQIEFWDSPNQAVLIKAILKVHSKDMQSDVDDLLSKIQRILT